MSAGHTRNPDKILNSLTVISRANLSVDWAVSKLLRLLLAKFSLHYQAVQVSNFEFSVAKFPLVCTVLFLLQAVQHVFNTCGKLRVPEVHFAKSL